MYRSQVDAGEEAHGRRYLRVAVAARERERVDAVLIHRLWGWRMEVRAEDNPKRTAQGHVMRCDVRTACSALSYFNGRTRHIDQIRTATEQGSCTFNSGRERKQSTYIHWPQDGAIPPRQHDVVGVSQAVRHGAWHSRHGHPSKHATSRNNPRKTKPEKSKKDRA